MSKEAEYRGFAALCLEIASNTLDETHKLRLLRMAEAWMDLIDRTSRVAKHTDINPEHPLDAETLRRSIQFE